MLIIWIFNLQSRWREESSSQETYSASKRLGFSWGGMPRSKRRAPSSTNHNSREMSPSAQEDGMPRHPSKRLRHTSK